ncbi:YbhB/YbcL family Raf kinase inhibitor-like protein [Solitalea koreensis]|uniref:Phospholipid-binding protein, PBP family n=1 Tax=Solitalea koreensis TaxID=543615 RepID=A0A521C4Q8_9SPHI|nr:YbhB/YbcL family Raf kinase inhibitor-like protein [Solitalea koreensis]SMO54477.1 phospholipid-binding protein, PBP family [Solitalea koreensis]
MADYGKARLAVSSTAFDSNEVIPVQYTCDGSNINPSLQIHDIPEQAQSLVLVVDDPDAPMGTWDHWLVWNIEPTSEIKENSTPGIEGINSFEQHQYGGPCPPSGTHRYFFKVYALDQMIKLKADSRKHELLVAIDNHIIAYGELIGKYARIH